MWCYNADHFLVLDSNGSRQRDCSRNDRIWSIGVKRRVRVSFIVETLETNLFEAILTLSRMVFLPNRLQISIANAVEHVVRSRPTAFIGCEFRHPGMSFPVGHVLPK